MPKKNEKSTIKIDGTEYSLESLSENAQSQIANIRFVDTQVQQLNNELAVADTARMGYTSALKAELEKTKKTD